MLFELRIKSVRIKIGFKVFKVISPTASWIRLGKAGIGVVS